MPVLKSVGVGGGGLTKNPPRQFARQELLFAFYAKDFANFKLFFLAERLLSLSLAPVYSLNITAISVT
jgi:hypothetical protein